MIREGFYIAINSLRKWTSDIRYAILFIMMYLILWYRISPVVDFCHATQYRVNPLVFVFFSDNPLMQLILMAGIIFLFSNAPFMDHNQPFVIARSGRYAWALGQIIYIILGSAIYFVVLIIGSIIMLSPICTFATEGWGKVVNTLAYTDASQSFNLQLWIEPKIINQYSPWQAMLACFALLWMTGALLGLVMFCMNLISKSKLGNFIAAVLVLFDLLIYNTLPFSFIWASPVSLARLNDLDPTRTSHYPTPQYAFIFIGACLILLSLLSVLSMRKRSIDIIQEV